MDLGLTGKRAIVLAASKGLGHGVAHALAAEGCSVAICARDGAHAKKAAEAIAQETAGAVEGWACDVSDGPQLAAFMAAAEAHLGGVDILVNNAGGPPPGPFAAFSDAEWADAVDLTLMSVIRATRYVLPAMIDQKHGRIITVTSTSVRQPLADMTLSNTLRPALAGLMRSLATEVAPHGVTVHCLMPGGFLTDRNRTLGERIARDKGIAFDDLVKTWEAGIPMGRMGDPLEFGQVAAFLASERSSFVTGSCFAVDGGQLRVI